MHRSPLASTAQVRRRARRTRSAAPALRRAVAAVAAIAVATGAFVLSPGAGAAEPAVDESLFPVPDVRGPIPSAVGDPAVGHTFMSSDLVGHHHYVETEFIYSGTANRYNATVAGGIGSRATPSPTADIVSSGHPYTTRMVVRRPADGADFNGTVVVEWLNATSGYDVEAMWYRTHEQIMREGTVWVGITAQSVTITNPTLGLKRFDPVRYGDLDLTAGGQFTSGDPLSYDVYGQGIQAVRHAGVLGDIEDDIQTVVSAGVSQSAGRLSVFTNAIQTRGEPVADAALLFIGGEKIRDDLPIPVFKVYSESENATSVFNTLQPDTDGMRTWHVTGTTHSDWQSMIVRYPELIRDQPTAALADTCAQGPTRSRIPERYTWAAATEHLVNWARDGVLPPTADPLFTPQGTIERDSFGNALGGLRLAPVEVPIAKAVAGCGLNGIYVPFDTATLNALYPDRDSYLTPFFAAVEQNVAAGYVLPADADEMWANAQSSLIGRGLTCEDLCANVSQFPVFPSTQSLRDQVASFFLPGGSELVDLADRATLSVAKGQTDAAAKGKEYAKAIGVLSHFQDLAARAQREGRATVGQSDLLIDFADVLITRLSFADVGLTVESRCTGPRARLTVTAVNTGSLEGRIDIASPHGSTSAPGTRVDKAVKETFTTETAQLAAGSVEATITALVDGAPVVSTATVPFEALSCR
ncbi:alpha/beta hydrolase domain-containing protein [Microbacterium sp. NPDC056569]|uniref:alpha/beta hydrolase domain-containing protein n=1 Tax=Microbacterium sp. NPDC056569 TaxID=3345867 RepID=UPI00367041CA